VCADPNNLPFSNRKGEGFENHLAEMLAKDLGQPLTYSWWPQRRGFFRNTLKAGVCDVVMGVPVQLDLALTTHSYYRARYAVVSRKKDRLAIRSLDDPRLRTLKIGVQLIGDDGANAPPVHALGRRGIVSNLIGYSVFGDYSTAAPLALPVQAVESSAVDVSIVWGPIGSYFAKRSQVPLEVTPLAEAEDDGLPLSFDIGMAVRRGDTERKARLERFLDREKAAIGALLARYGVISQ
jgi:quinoprotein dehydrogenase-associated probable ABC transporter substrate-binding protein